jgi:flagellar biosynthesis protein FlhF
MKIKKFVAPTLPEALSKIKQDMGQDAVILKTRFSSPRDGSLNGEKCVEVTAAIDQAPVSTPAAPPVPTPAPVQESGPVIVPPVINRIELETLVDPDLPIQTPSEILGGLKGDMATLMKEFGRLTAQSLFGQPHGIQIEIARLLVEKNMPEALAIQLVKNLSTSLEKLIDIDAAWDQTKKNLLELLSPGEPVKLYESGASVIMLIGPTGSGKTSAAARLAFHHGIEKDLPVTLISTDTFRADSREQLKSLATVIGCPSLSISSPEELTVALRSYKKGLIIIDTTGFSSPRDITELLPLTGAANPHEIHLVIPADMAAKDITRIVTGFPELKIDKLLVSKLDQSHHRGGVIAAASARDLKFSYQSASREIPGLFELFNPASFVSAFMPALESDSSKQSNSFEVVGW